MKLSELIMMGIIAFVAGAVVVKTLGLDDTRTERQETYSQAYSYDLDP